MKGYSGRTPGVLASSRLARSTCDLNHLATCNMLADLIMCTEPSRPSLRRML